MLRLAAFLIIGAIIAEKPPTPTPTPKPTATPPPAVVRRLDIRPDPRLAGLGALQNDLLMWLNMDSTERGVVAWSAINTRVVASPEVTIKEGDGRQWMDFNTRGAVLKLEPVLMLPPAYTLVTWLRLPAPKKHALVWQGVSPDGAPLVVTDTGISGYIGTRGQHITYAALPAGLTGWHQFAITYDGKATHAFLDAKEVGKVDACVGNNLRTIGNHFQKDHQDWMMCDGLDEQFTFNRALTAEELAKLRDFSAGK
jgi:hypothetical protein